MKKFLTISLLVFLPACAGISNVPGNITDTGAKISASNCQDIKGVNDPQNGGKIYYTKEHRLYNFIKLDPTMGDKNFCTLDIASNAGFDRVAPQYFEDSAFKMVQCLNTESENGSCHNYINGIFQSLKIYDKTCGNPSKSDLARAYKNHADKAVNGMDVSKYSGATSAFISRFGC